MFKQLIEELRSEAGLIPIEEGRNPAGTAPREVRIFGQGLAKAGFKFRRSLTRKKEYEGSPAQYTVVSTHFYGLKMDKDRVEELEVHIDEWAKRYGFKKKRGFSQGHRIIDWKKEQPVLPGHKFAQTAHVRMASGAMSGDKPANVAVFSGYVQK